MQTDPLATVLAESERKQQVEVSYHCLMYIATTAQSFVEGPTYNHLSDSVVSWEKTRNTQMARWTHLVWVAATASFVTSP
jgi:hypothetical protein